MSEPTNKTTPPRPSGEVWPEILRLQGKIASLDLQLTESLKNQLRSEETISQLLSQIPQASTEDSSVVQTDTPRTDAALGDDGRRTHKEILEIAFKASGWKLWKEKYIDLKNAHIAEGQDPAGTIWEHADKLQAELKASQAQSHGMSRRVVESEMKLEIANKDLRASEAEVERLLTQLKRVVEIAEGFCGCGCGGDYGLCNFCSDQFSELDQIKSTLNPNDK